MNIKCKRAMLVNGKHQEAGDVIEVPTHIGLDLVNMGKGEVVEKSATVTDRAIGLTKKSAASLVKRNTKKK